MFFFLSKTIGLLPLPSNLFIVLALVGVVVTATRWRRAGARLAVIGCVFLLAAGFRPVGNLLTHALESRFPPWDAARGAPAGIVVLGRAISPVLSQMHGEPLVHEEPGRVIALAKLAR